MSERDGFDPVEDFAADLRAAFVSPPSDEVRAAHLMAMKDLEPLPAPAGRSRSRRRPVVRGAIAAAGFVLVSGSALAATGNFPDGVQDALSAAADAVGIDIPPGHTKLPDNPTAAENKQDAIEFVTAQRAWVDCMKEAKKASPSPSADAEPEASPCGEKPQPSDFRDPKAEKTPKPEKTEKPEKTNPSADRPEKTDKPSATPKGNPSDDRPEKTDNPNKPSSDA